MEPIDAPIEYMARTRAWYEALGYPAYRWAHHEDVPFSALARPLAAARLALVTTAAPYDPRHGEQGPGAPYNAAAKFFAVFERSMRPPPDLRISHLGYDRVHARAEDANCWLPIAALEAAEAAGRIGALAPRLIGLPTDRSQRNTLERDAPAVLAACRAQAVDAVLLVPT